MPWFAIYSLLEKHAPTSPLTLPQYEAEVNQNLADHGIAYEMRGGELHRFDPTPIALGINEANESPLDTLTGEFRPAHDHYRTSPNRSVLAAGYFKTCKVPLPAHSTQKRWGSPRK